LLNGYWKNSRQIATGLHGRVFNEALQYHAVRVLNRAKFSATFSAKPRCASVAM
jgi:hypothetical protein